MTAASLVEHDGAGSRSPTTRFAPENESSTRFVPRQRTSLADLYADVIYLAIDVRRANRMVAQPQQFRDRVLGELDRAGGAALDAGYSAAEVVAARYAVASYADESVLTSTNPLREYWQVNPLQLQLYDDNRAGEAFFKRLEKLRQVPEHHFRLLELYGLCLALGFEGRYRLDGKEALGNISAGVSQEIARLRGSRATQLAPHAVLRERRKAFAVRFPVWVWPALAAVALWLAHRGLEDRLSVRAGALSQQATVLANLPLRARPDMQSVLNAMLKGKTIAFESGRDVLTPQGARFLDTLVPVLQREPNAQVAVNGHTDNVGSAASNQLLSERRAQAVLRYLADHGVATGRMQAHGYGATQPVADNATPEGQAQNRRIEFKVLEDAGAP